MASTRSKEKFHIGSDFADSLRLYNLPKNLAEEILNHPNVHELLVTSDLNLLSDSGCEIFFGHKITSLHIDKMQNLKWIHLGTSGYDKIDLTLCKKRGIAVTNSSVLIAESLASHALSFVFSLMRSNYFNLALSNPKDFTREIFDFNFDQVNTPRETKVLIFGSGLAALTLATWLSAMGFLVNIVSVSNRRIQDLPAGVIQIDSRTADDVLSFQNFVVNLLPKREDTTNYFNAKRLSQLGKDTFFVSVGRGSTTDENTLINLLSKQKIAGAGLDVFYKEPLSSDSLFFDLPNLIMTPHIAAVNSKYWPTQVGFFLDNLKSFALGHNLRSVLEER
jgi:D-2-hydroxyacid dehydrogenase (NADP+)